MRDLIEMIKFVGPKHLRQISILGDSNQETKLNKLYDAYLNGKFNNENELANKIFNITADSPQYRQLKSKLKNRLLNNLFLIDANEALFKSYSKAFENCRKLFFAAEILYAKGARLSSITFAEKAFRMAEKFEFTDICEFSSQFLRNAFRVTGNKRKLKYYRELSDQYYHQYWAEQKAKKIYLDISEDSELFVQLDEEYYNYLDEKENELVKLLEEYSGPYTLVFGFGALCTIKLRQSNYHLLVSYAKQAINRLSEYHFLPKIFLLNFYNIILSAALALNNFEIGKSVIEESDLFLSGVKGINLIYIKENYIILAIRTGNYEHAINIYRDITESKIFKKAPPALVEMWEMFAALLFLLKTMGKTDDSNNIISGFKMGKFMNSADSLKKDKLGYNLSFLLLQTIYFLHRKDYDEVMESLERLKTYNYRYLRKEESYRSQCFVKMLMTLPDAKFHRAAVERKSKRWFEKLKGSDISVSVNSLKGEIIPYEIQWEIILGLLDNKFRRNA